MSATSIIAHTPVLESLGWTLLHFLWEGALIAIVVAVALALLRNRCSNTRYIVCCGGLVMMVAAPIVTFAILSQMETLEHAADVLPAFLVPLEGQSETVWERLSSVLPTVTVFWFLGMFALQVRLLRQWIGVRRLAKLGTSPAPELWRRTTASLAAQLGIRRAVTIVESARAATPMLVGWLKPVILVPASAWTGLTTAQLKSVLAHELAHVRRHDYLVNVMQAVVETVLFYHPAVWWMSHRLRVEREYCCDDVAVRATGDALTFAQALSALDTLRAGQYEPALASTGGLLMNRICRLINVRTPHARHNKRWLAPMAAAAIITTGASAIGYAMTPDDEADRTEAKSDEAEFIADLLLHVEEGEHANTLELLNEDMLIAALQGDDDHDFTVDLLLELLHESDHADTHDTGDAHDSHAAHAMHDAILKALLADGELNLSAEALHGHINDAITRALAGAQAGKHNQDAHGQWRVLGDPRADTTEAHKALALARIGAADAQDDSGRHAEFIKQLLHQYMADGAVRIRVDDKHIEELLRAAQDKAKVHRLEPGEAQWGRLHEIIRKAMSKHDHAMKDLDPGQLHKRIQEAMKHNQGAMKHLDLEKLHEHLRHLPEIDIEALHGHLQAMPELNIEALHGHLQAMPELNIEALHGRYREVEKQHEHTLKKLHESGASGRYQKAIKLLNEGQLHEHYQKAMRQFESAQKQYKQLDQYGQWTQARRQFADLYSQQKATASHAADAMKLYEAAMKAAKSTDHSRAYKILEQQYKAQAGDKWRVVRGDGAVRDQIHEVQKKLDAVETHLDDRTSDENLRKLEELNKRIEDMLRRLKKERSRAGSR